MADRVIVCGVTRGRSSVSVSELKQMVGRAGRRHGGGSCKATIVLHDEDCGIEVGMEEKRNCEVQSTMGEYETLGFHLLPEIVSGKVKSREEAKRWYGRTLGAFQGKEVDWEKVFGLLKAAEAIEEGREIQATGIGETASRFYLNAGDVWGWKTNFSEVFNLGLENNDQAVAWALGTVPVTRFSGDFGKHREIFQLFKDGLPEGLGIVDGTMTGIVLWWYVLGGPPVGPMRNQALSLRRDSGRVSSALRCLDKQEGWGKEKFFDELESRMWNRIPSELAELCRIPGITKGRARYLNEMGVTCLADLPEFMESLPDEIEGQFLEVLRGLTNGES